MTQAYMCNVRSCHESNEAMIKSLANKQLLHASRPRYVGLQQLLVYWAEETLSGSVNRGNYRHYQR